MLHRTAEQYWWGVCLTKDWPAVRVRLNNRHGTPGGLARVRAMLDQADGQWAAIHARKIINDAPGPRFVTLVISMSPPGIREERVFGAAETIGLAMQWLISWNTEDIELSKGWENEARELASRER